MKEVTQSSNDKKTSSQAMNLNECSAKSTIHHYPVFDLDPTLREDSSYPCHQLGGSKIRKKMPFIFNQKSGARAFLGHVNLLG